jgi:hypothetical protein
MPMLNVLVIYGVPPAMDLVDAAGKVQMGTFEKLTKDNRHSFEVALRHALAAFVKDDASVLGARFVFVRSGAGMAAALKSGAYTQVIYYGHALEGGANGLVPDGDPDHAVYTSELARALQGTTVTHFDILGCMSASLAAELFTVMPKLRIGYLRADRHDVLEVSPRTHQVISMTIEPQKLFHYGQ